MSNCGVFDVSCLAHKAFYSAKKTLVLKDIQPKIVALAMASLVYRIRNTLDLDCCAFCLDSSKSIRRQFYPSYKVRDMTPEKAAEKRLVSESCQAFTKLLTKLGFKNIFGFDGYEADDIIARVCQSDSFDYYFIISTDSDLYQLLSDKVSMFLLHKWEVFNKEQFEYHYCVTPNLWPKIKALTGCKSDNIKGIMRVGNVIASWYVTKQRGKIGSTLLDRIRKNRKLIRLNYKVIRLPLEGTPNVVLVNDNPNWRRLQTLIDASWLKYTS